MCYEVSFVKLKLFLESYLSYVSIIGDVCAISFGDGLFLVVPYMTKCLSSNTSLEDPLISSGVKFYPSCFGFWNILIDSKTYAYHLHHFNRVLSILRNAKLYANLGNYEFCVENGTSLGYIVSCQGFQVGANIVQAIKYWLISKSAFEMGSFYGFTIFYNKFIKDLSTISSLLIDVLEKKTGFTWQIRLFLIKFALNQAYHSTTHCFSFEVDYGFKLLTSSFAFGWKENMQLIKYIHSKNHDVVYANNKTFGMQRLVFDPRGLVGVPSEKCPTADGSPALTVTGRLLPVKLLEDGTLLHPIGLTLSSPVGFCWDSANEIDLSGFRYLACLFSF
ncbi:hypothetical protein M9H77_35401 [Catharanthus roseus]|uniref:Uncharacterized protein n=1 Tax=Catharanthus roseus TaxID=4058 RepID=A0ACB9ZQ72_CATRO|nr:hypothetical protein M9H77_35401 [Catharanthus roseus]